MATHVLVINDTPEILDLFQQLLGEEGYRVTTDRFAEEPATLLARIKTERPDLVVLDFLIGRDEVKGWQFLQLLKMDRATRDIPVVICTGAAQQAKELRTHLDAMGVAVVLKPFDIDHLLAVMAGSLTGPRTDAASG